MLHGPFAKMKAILVEYVTNPVVTYRKRFQSDIVLAPQGVADEIVRTIRPC